MQVVVSEDLTKNIEQLEHIVELLEKINTNVQKLRFVTIKELAEAGNMSIPTAQDIFNRPDFPSCDFPKGKIAEINAVIKYFSVPRRK